LSTVPLWVIFALLDPDPDSEYGSGSTDLIDSDPNPQPWQKLTTGTRLTTFNWYSDFSTVIRECLFLFF
jgi:hypothetical protein